MLLSWVMFCRLVVMLLGIILGCYVATMRRPKALALALLVMSVHAGLRAFRDVIETPMLAFTYGLIYLYGVCLYFGIRELLQADFRYRRQHLLHLLPFIVIEIGLLSGGLNHSAVGLLLMPTQAVYIGLCIALVIKPASQTRLLFWLRLTMAIFLLVFVLQILRFFLQSQWLLDSAALLESAFFSLTGSILILLVFQGLRHPPLRSTVASDRELDSYRSLQTQLENCMREQQPYLDPKLTVAALAEQIGVPARQLSEAINALHQESFSEYINRARVAAAETLICEQLDNERFSLLDIALDAGFNSKSSFNLMFKRYNGNTPSAFRKQQLQRQRELAAVQG